MKTSHMLFCAVLLIASVVLLSSGVGGLAFLPLLLCGLMMGGMVWMMMRGHGHGHQEKPPVAGLTADLRKRRGELDRLIDEREREGDGTL